MDKLLRVITLRLYRQLRAGHPPAEALVLLRDRVRAARQYAEACGYASMAFLLGDEASCLTQWLQDARLCADRTDRHGRYWQTGKYQERLTFTLECHAASSEIRQVIKCGAAGYAIMHAFGWLVENNSGYVNIACNRPAAVRRVDFSSTWATLLQLDWPVD